MLHFTCVKVVRLVLVYYAPALIGGGIKRCFCLTSDVCLLRTSGLTLEQRPKDQNWHRGSPRHTWLGHHFQGQRSKGQRSRSPGCFTRRGLNAWGRCSGDRENVLGVGNHCYVASARRRARLWGAHGGGEGRGISCRHAHSLLKATWLDHTYCQYFYYS